MRLFAGTTHFLREKTLFTYAFKIRINVLSAAREEFPVGKGFNDPTFGPQLVIRRGGRAVPYLKILQLPMPCTDSIPNPVGPIAL